MKETYKIAEKVIEINSLYEDVHKLCREYKFNDIPDFSVEISQGDIDYERNEKNFSDGYLETLAVYRKIAEKMIDYDTILFHGSAIAVDGAGYIFTAKSGTGKSTHTRLWREYFGERAFMVNDDKPLIKIGGKGAFIHGTAWDGKHRLSSNISVPLKAICVLNRGAENKIKRISKSEAYPVFLQQVYRIKNKEKMEKIFALLDFLCANVPVYRLECNMKSDAVTTAYNFMKTEE